MDLTFSNVDSLGQKIGDFITSRVELPEKVQAILNLEFLGNTVTAYAFLAVAIFVGWIVSFFVSFAVGRILRMVLGRISEKFAIGVSRAIAGPIRISVLCWIALQGTVFLVKPPPPVIAPVESSATAVEGQKGAASTPNTPVVAPPVGSAPAPDLPQAAAEGIASLLVWQPHWTYLVLRAFFKVCLVLSLFWIVARLVRFFWLSYINPWLGKSVRGVEKRYFELIYRLGMIALWLWALLSSIAALGFDSRDQIKRALGYSAANNTVSAYLSFIGLVLLAFLLGRTLFEVLTRGLTKVMAQFGGEKVHVEKTWFSGLERPTIALITLIGFNFAAAATLTPSKVFPDIHGIAMTGIHVCLTVVITWIAFVFIDKFFQHILLPLTAASAIELDDQLLVLARKTAKIGIGIVGFIFMIKAIGHDPGTILAGLGIGGIAVSFAAKDTLSNFMAGLTIYASKPFRVADYIVLLKGENEGFVEEIGLRATIVRKRDGTKLIIPNEMLTSSVVSNRTVNGRIKEKIQLSIDIATPPEKRDQAIQLFVRTAHEVEGVEGPSVDFIEYGEDSLELILSYWVSKPDRLGMVRTSLLLLIDTRLRDLGVEMSVSHLYAGYLHNGRQVGAANVMEAMPKNPA